MAKKEIQTNEQSFLRGRGAQINPNSPYEKIKRDEQPMDWALAADDWETPELRTEYIETQAKSILNKVESVDIPMEWSLNPYQGCEHGCVYCYARNTHPYWGYSAGLDFERKIIVKCNAAELLAKELQKKSWKASTVMFAGNTDIYQPAERKYKITRSLLEVFWKYRHPVGLITKNSMVLRDLDLLKNLAAENLVSVALSITTLNEELRQFLEPRTASVQQRLRTVETLSQHGVPVFVMMAPIIPGLNDHEIFSLAEKVASLGARGIACNIVRLNGDVAVIFEDWLRKTMPDRAEKVLNKIRETHGGTLSDSRTRLRMRGEGKTADIIHEQMRIARARYFAGREMPKLNLELHEGFKTAQLRLF